MSGRTARMLGALAAVASGLAMACAPAEAAGEHFVNAPRNASINSSSEIAIDGPTLAAPGALDGVNSIGFSAGLPQDVLGAYIYCPRRVYKAQKLCVRRNHRRRVCRRVKRY